jgi:hypothetical protein
LHVRILRCIKFEIRSTKFETISKFKFTKQENQLTDCIVLKC